MVPLPLSRSPFQVASANRVIAIEVSFGNNYG